MNGFDDTKSISNIYFKDVDFRGEPLTSEDQISANNFVSDIHITSSNEPQGAPVYHYYDLELYLVINISTCIALHEL